MKDIKRKRPAPEHLPMPTGLDPEAQLNWNIVSLLQEDGRLPFSTIADKLGVSEGTVRNRVKQLRDENVMNIGATVLAQAFGYSWNSIVFVKIAQNAHIDEVGERLAALGDVYYVVQLSGRFDLGVASYHRDREHFCTFLAEHFYGRPDIASVEPNVNLKVFKMKLRWQNVPLEG
jgi:Lrp/AsnC family transcriptional regulator, regulator for asnA, asnC and gidA